MTRRWKMLMVAAVVGVAASAVALVMTMTATTIAHTVAAALSTRELRARRAIGSDAVAQRGDGMQPVADLLRTGGRAREFVQRRQRRDALR